MGEITGAGSPSTSRVDDTTVRGLFRNRNIRIFVPVAFISSTGSFMQALGVPFVLYELTKSNTWVGAAVFANWMSSLLVTPLAASLVDRVSRRVVMLGSNIVQLIAATGLWLLALGDDLTKWRILGLLSIGGLAAGFQYSASQSLIPVLVEHHQRVLAVRINAVGFTAARALGPALAGAVLHLWGVRITFALNAVSFLVVIAALALVRERAVDRSAAAAGRWREQFVAGARYLLERRGLRRAVFTMFVTAFCGSGTAQLAAGIAKEVYGVDSDGLGWLVAATGLGAMTAAILLVFLKRLPRSTGAQLGIAVYALGIAILASSSVFAVGLVAFFVLGLGHVTGGTSVSTSLHAQVQETYRGRIIGFYLMAVLAGTPLGSLTWGWIGDALGLRPAAAISCAVLATYLAYVLVRFDGLRNLDLDHDERDGVNGAEHLSAVSADSVGV